MPRNTFQNDSFRSKRISFPSLPKHWCRLAHTRCRQVTTIGGGWGPAMSSIATILPGTPGPSCDSQALGGAQSQTKQIYDEVYSAEMITDTIWQDGFPSSTKFLHNEHINMMLNTEYQQQFSLFKKTKLRVLKW